MADVGSSLNQLADRIDELVAEERETVANLSHRMRTPLTALRVESESLRDPAERERIATQASALERTLTAVIHAARRPQREGRLPSADATAVVRDRVAFWSALTDEQERACTLTLPDGPLLVRTSAEDLAAAVDALIENVVAHAPRARRSRCRCAPLRRTRGPRGARVAAASAQNQASPFVPDAAVRLDQAPGPSFGPGSAARPVRPNAVLSPGDAIGAPALSAPFRTTATDIEPVRSDRADRERRRTRVAGRSRNPRAQRPRFQRAGALDRAPVRLGSSVVLVLPASSQREVVKGTFLLCPKGTLSLCCHSRCHSRPAHAVRFFHTCCLRVGYTEIYPQEIQ